MSPQLNSFVERAFKGVTHFLGPHDHRRLKRARSKAIRRMRREAASVVEYMVIHENERALAKVRKEAKQNGKWASWQRG